ncbi:hypothetical protein D3C72_2554970 [compost metagenome]
MMAERKALVANTTLNDAALAEGLQRMLAAEPEIRNRFGLDEAVFAYLGRVVALSDCQ